VARDCLDGDGEKDKQDAYRTMRTDKRDARSTMRDDKQDAYAKRCLLKAILGDAAAEKTHGGDSRVRVRVSVDQDIKSTVS